MLKEVYFFKNCEESFLQLLKEVYAFISSCYCVSITMQWYCFFILLQFGKNLTDDESEKLKFSI